MLRLLILLLLQLLKSIIFQILRRWHVKTLSLLIENRSLKEMLPLRRTSMLGRCRVNISDHRWLLLYDYYVSWTTSLAVVCFALSHLLLFTMITRTANWILPQAFMSRDVLPSNTRPSEYETLFLLFFLFNKYLFHNLFHHCLQVWGSIVF